MKTKFLFFGSIIIFLLALSFIFSYESTEKKIKTDLDPTLVEESTKHIWFQTIIMPLVLILAMIIVMYIVIIEF